MRSVKDKRIIKSGDCFLAVVEYYRDTPAKENHTHEQSSFNTIKASQKWLAKFPSDGWDGYTPTDPKYREADDGRRRSARENSRNHSTRSGTRPTRLSGRSLVGHMPKRA